MKITKQQLKKIVKEELLKELGGEEGLGAGSSPVGRGRAMNLLEDVMEHISAAYNSLTNPTDQEDFEKYLNENVAVYTAKWQEEREYGAEEEEPEVDPETGAPESPQKMGHPYDYPPGEEWRHKY